MQEIDHNTFTLPILGKEPIVLTAANQPIARSLYALESPNV